MAAHTVAAHTVARGTRRALALGAVAMLSTGCASVLRAAADNPAALAFLPVAAAAEVIGAAAKESRKPSTGMLTFTPAAGNPGPLAYRDWQDPDDWVAACDGPMLCSEHEQFACTGTPGDCCCDCVGTSSTPPVDDDFDGTLVRADVTRARGR